MAENNAINKQTEDLIVNKASGDPFVNFQIASTDEFVIGVDDDDTDSLKINQGGASPSAGTNTWKMTAAGERIMVLQPASKAHLGTQATNVTGDGTLYTVIFNTEVYDQNADYNNATGTFTAPISGRYMINASAYFSGLGAGNTTCNLRVVTTDFTYISYYQAGLCRVGTTSVMHASIFANLDATDTASIIISAAGGALVVDILASASSFFDCTLIC